MAIVGGGLAAAGALLSGLMGGASSARAAAAAERQNQLMEQGLADARNNEQYQRMLSSLINQRSVAGTTDSFGSSVQYDPATNSWRTTLGAQPFAAQTAATQAGITRNTTDMQAAELANQEAARRATQAQPAADTAVRNLTAFRPMGSDQLVGLLQQQATNANNATFRPLVADTLRSFQRAGTAAGPVLAELGRQQANNLRDNLIDAQIRGMTGVDQINQSRRSGLQSDVAATSALATPQFQYPGINSADPNATLANLVSSRAQQGGFAPAYGMGGVNTASSGSQAALKGYAGSTPVTGPEEIGKQIGNMLQNKDFTSNVQSMFQPGGMFGSKVYNGDLSNYAQNASDYQFAPGFSFGSDNP